MKFLLSLILLSFCISVNADEIADERYRVVALSSTVEAALKEMNLSDSIIASSRDFSYPLQYEKIVALKPSHVIVYDFQDYEKLKNLGVNVILSTEYLDSSPIERYKTMMNLSRFFNREAMASSLYEDKLLMYEHLKKTVHHKKKVKVVVGELSKRNFIPSSKNSFVKNLVRDAGGQVVEVSGIEELLLTRDQIDYVLTLNSTMCDFKFPRIVGNNSLNKFGDNEFYISGAVNPDLMLKELIDIFHHQQVKGRWFAVQ